MALWGMCERKGHFILLSVLLFLLTGSIWLSGLCVKEGSFNCIVCPALLLTASGVECSQVSSQLESRYAETSTLRSSPTWIEC